MWKAVLGYLWGWKIIPLIFVQIVSLFWFTDPANAFYHDLLTGIVMGGAFVVIVVEGFSLYKKLSK